MKLLYAVFSNLLSTNDIGGKKYVVDEMVIELCCGA
jgi:hypothetical protein